MIINNDAKVVVQGITGRQGSYHTKLMREYGTNIVAGVTPGKSYSNVEGVPVYNTVEEALGMHDADTAIIFVPAPQAKSAIMEAIENKLSTVIIITEHIPIKDTIEIISKAKLQKVNIIGPNTPGVIVPGQTKLGIMPANIFKSGSIGMISRSGTLTYEIALQLTKRGLGQSTCVGVGGDPIIGWNFIDVLELFKADPATDKVVLVGEIGGNLEELTAQYIIDTHYPKQVVAYIAGLSAPPEKRMGHAGAIIMGKQGTAQSKIEALEKAGVKIARKPSDVPKLLIS